MSKEVPLKLIIGAVSNEKGVSEEVIFEALTAALVSATKKKYGDIDVAVNIDKKTGTYDTTRIWTVVEDELFEDDDKEISVTDAKERGLNLDVGQQLTEPMESVEFGRIAAQAAKQVIIQKVREAERNLVAKEFSEKVGTLISGVVKKVTRDNIIVDLGGNAEGIIKRDNMLPKEAVRMGDRVRAYLKEISDNPRGPQMVLSRTDVNMLVELFKIEVPEVSENIIEIKSASREPGVRAKIAVKTNDGRIDPVGACVGMRGARVQAVSNELNGERVDIILWDDDPVQFVMNAMSPAEIVSITLDEENNSMLIAVKETHLSQAIGRNGQNIKLATELTGWHLNVVSEQQAEEQQNSENTKLLDLFVSDLNVDEEVAEVLVTEGFTSIEEVAYVPVEEFLGIEGFTEEIAESLKARAQECLDKAESNTDLFLVEGMTQELAKLLQSKGINERDDLAEQSVDELIEIAQLTEEDAGKLIMAARAHWFADEE